MDKTIMGLLGGASALALLGGGQASAAAPVDGADGLPPARSFAELLDPIPNAANVLRADDERALADPSGDAKPIVVAQYDHSWHHHWWHHHWWHHHWWHHHWWHHHYY